ncbi:hypothetical protein QOZ80_5AG0394800 [Eleusine coracana subsp. coracana]|nr:hypothetical protein QOZ80_5AG0394800 [Eleusine coracana subsp. coracana]
MQASSLHTLLLLATSAILLPALVSSPVVAAGDSFGGGRMLIVRGARTAGGAGRVTKATSAWLRRLEDEVAPEFPLGDGLLRGGIDIGVLDKNNPVCLKREGCAARCKGCSYTRPCLYLQRCPQGN